ncbi:Spo0E like sporulation regulatory family protein [Candidatus Desulfosporosinus infrequens]|uniref:Spo0E like sporulation regulatory family protein n=1 Tax=Candidatus Desulfosporosinus infrequens TaxID=2043169 RepID=A0A2U3K8N1_9FIRM|nr:Spo0E like sporulation regulatory family protein [Candidatus Desulfosporosinus infrequens]
MSEINELIKQIEELRMNVINTKEGRAYTDPVVVAASQKLDDALDRYQELLMKKVVPTNA